MLQPWYNVRGHMRKCIYVQSISGQAIKTSTLLICCVSVDQYMDVVSLATHTLQSQETLFLLRLEGVASETNTYVHVLVYPFKDSQLPKVS